MVIRSLPLLTPNAQNKGKIVCLSIQNKGKLFHYTHIHITFKIRRTHKKMGANL